MRFALLSLALCSAVLSLAAESSARAGSPPGHTLRNAAVGYSLSYPDGWKITAKVVATEFAAGAGCQSVRVVDFVPPPAAGPSAQVRHSFVQLCWKRVTDGSSLEDFMHKTYGPRLSGVFEKTTLGGVAAYRAKDGTGSTTFFLQTDSYRIQIVAAVVADKAKRAKRSTQVSRILASFSLKS